MNPRTRAIQSILCALCKGRAWHESQQPVRVGVAWHHPNCRNVIGPARLDEITLDSLQRLKFRRPRALR